MQINRIVDELDIEEKIALVSGADNWHTMPIPRLNIPSIMMADGPHGLRKEKDESKPISVGEGVKATCFPPAATSANSWNPELLFQMGEAIGNEALQEGVSIVLGPGVNIKRSPLCGRNFEYFSEDPFLTGELATGWIKGAQSVGVGACIKHFAVNNQESWRMINDSVVDERALREIYLAGFEQAIKQGKPWTVMAAYNKLNGIYCCENPRLLTSILRTEWGFDGAVISDWNAVDDRVLALRAGLDLEMPSSQGTSAELIRNDLQTGRLTEGMLNRSVREVLKLAFGGEEKRRENHRYDIDAHHNLAKEIAVESTVLLKNEDNILPLNKKQKVAILGALADQPRYQGFGSSVINPTKLDTVLEQFSGEIAEFEYARGYYLDKDEVNYALLAEATRAAKEADVVVIFAGLTPEYESEGYDRKHLNLPPAQNVLIEEIAKIHSNIIVVLSSGAPVLMPWLEQVQAVFHSYLGGQAGAAAIFDLLFGNANPSGKLAETYPLSLEDYPVQDFFAYDPYTTEYRESIFVGYRYFDVAQKEVLFPFGYGLSYTKFKYTRLTQSAKKIKDTDELVVSCTIENTGSFAGYEVAQLYIEKEKSPLFRAVRELKGFKKIWLEPGEKGIVEFTLNPRSFAYFNVEEQDWHVEGGSYLIKVGSSSRDLPISGKVEIESTRPEVKVPSYEQRAPVYYSMDKDFATFPEKDFRALFSKDFPKSVSRGERFTRNSTLEELQVTVAGRLIAKVAKKKLWKMAGAENENDPSWQMMWKTVMEMPLRALVSGSGGTISDGFIRGLVAWVNGQYGRAITLWFRF